MQKIQIYATPTYTSVTIQNGASRDTSGPDLPAIIAAMHPEDRATLAQFCTGILKALETEHVRIGGAR